MKINPRNLPRIDRLELLIIRVINRTPKLMCLVDNPRYRRLMAERDKLLNIKF